ncbi:sulfurtransferase [Bacillus pinisoli]|uniref:sulfurtransferase n=1 Tax=Bacillus pinisoli TaxID=2901866 RepID=UPI001FF5424E|nr:sulfurtransferase [Bacillus pinisoli]
MSYLKSIEWVASHYQDDLVRVIDCRFLLNNPNAGQEAYTESHIPNAAYLHLEADLSGPVKEHGGRHPLPNLQELSERLSSLGIDQNVTIVTYDDQNGAMASRCWWLLKYLGHENVFVMDGSFQTWQQRDLPVSSEIPQFQSRVFKPVIQQHLLAEFKDVKASLDSTEITLLDSREAPRFRGEVEPIDKIAGHIPGAVNYFWLENIASDGTWKKAEEHKERFQHISKERSVIVYCGSGVTACPNVLALHEAGFQDVKLYLGSWSDWISYEDSPVEKNK